VQDHFSIPTSIGRWLTLPTFDDEDQTRAAALFNTLILTKVTAGVWTSTAESV
jgi:hypothetical protein